VSGIVWAGSQFKNELDVLEIRLATIGHLVDRFVFAEADVDQRGNPKPLVLQEALETERFAPWRDKITYVPVLDAPRQEGRAQDWVRERFFRDAILRGMGDLEPDDCVFISDLDEIPNPDALRAALADPPWRFVMDLHVYRLNWRWRDRDEQIGTLGAVHCGQTFLNYRAINPVILAPVVHGGVFRLLTRARMAEAGYAPHVGWHLTYQGDVETLRQKMIGMADAFYEDLVPEAAKHGVSGPEDFLTDEWILGSIETGRDIYARDYRPSEWVGLDELPPYVQEHPEKFAHMLVERPAAVAA
jgi:beta-1,4-mannosyl-glycoprotein beta-1,4-N-acetylglucosaminyltransferase